MDKLMLEAAKSELAYTTASQISTLSDAAETSFINQALKGVPQTYQRDLLEKAGVSCRVCRCWKEPLLVPFAFLGCGRVADLGTPRPALLSAHLPRPLSLSLFATESDDR